MVTRFMVGRWLCAFAEFLPHSFRHFRDYLAWDLDALLNGDCLADLLWDRVLVFMAGRVRGIGAYVGWLSVRSFGGRGAWAVSLHHR